MSRRSRRRHEKWLKNRNRPKFQRCRSRHKRGSPGDYSYRAGWQDRHHIVAKQFGGKKNPENLILLDRNRHNAYHLVFDNMSFLEVIELLVRVLRMKNHPDYPEAEYEFNNYLETLEEVDNGTKCHHQSGQIQIDWV